jgi:hypothetical protein
MEASDSDLQGSARAWRQGEENLIGGARAKRTFNSTSRTEHPTALDQTGVKGVEIEIEDTFSDLRGCVSIRAITKSELRGGVVTPTREDSVVFECARMLLSRAHTNPIRIVPHLARYPKLIFSCITQAELIVAVPAPAKQDTSIVDGASVALPCSYRPKSSTRRDLDRPIAIDADSWEGIFQPELPFSVFAPAVEGRSVCDSTDMGLARRKLGDELIKEDRRERGAIRERPVTERAGFACTRALERPAPSERAGESTSTLNQDIILCVASGDSCDLVAPSPRTKLALAASTETEQIAAFDEASLSLPSGQIGGSFRTRHGG